MSRVLLTGARGFIGRHCLTLLQQRGAEVHAVTSGPVPAPEPGVVWHRADLRVPAEAARVVADARPDRVLHLAWVTTPGQYWESPDNIRWLEGSLALMRAAAEHGVQRFVAAGTCAEYDWSMPVLAETAPVRPASLYGTTKHALQLCLDRFAPGAGMSHAWGRVFFLYGPGEHPARLVPSVAASLLQDRPAECTSGEQVRDFLHVRDVADAFVHLLSGTVTGALNIASGEGHSVRHVVETIGALVGRPGLLRLGARPLPAGEPHTLLAETRRLNGEAGWQPSLSMDDGLADAVDWWRRQVPHARA
jgi:nucleoside-diphosphate-sugar epimerase